MPDQPCYFPIPLDSHCPRCHHSSLIGLPANSPPPDYTDPNRFVLLEPNLKTEWKVACKTVGCDFKTIWVGDLTLTELQKAIQMQATNKASRVIPEGLAIVQKGWNDGVDSILKRVLSNGQPSDELYEFACILKELLDTYDVLHVMPPAPGIDYNDLRTELDRQRKQLRASVDAVLVAKMGEQILQPHLRTKAKRKKKPGYKSVPL